MQPTPQRPPPERFGVPAIERMVHTFYARVREDEVLGPIFDARIEDWPKHLERMVSFWRAVLRAEPTFSPSPRGAPPVLHRQIEELRRADFARWLGLFEEVVAEVFSSDEAEEVLEAARRIAVALARHLPSEENVRKPEEAR